MPKFDVSFEEWSQDAIEAGDTDIRGCVDKGMDLRTAIYELFQTGSSYCSVECIDPSSSDISGGDWISVINSPEWFTGIQEIKSLHIPRGVTRSSAKRILRLVESGDYCD